MARAPRELQRFAQRSRDVVLASAAVGIVTGFAVAGAERLTVQLLDWVRGWPHWLVVVGPGIGLALGALTLRFLAFRASPGLADSWLQAFHDPNGDLDLRSAPGAIVASILTFGSAARWDWGVSPSSPAERSARSRRSGSDGCSGTSTPRS